MAASALLLAALGLVSSRHGHGHGHAHGGGRTRREVAAAGGAAAVAHVLPGAAGAADGELANAPRVSIETNAGVMRFELWPDVAPKTVENFIKLANEGFFDGQMFHRIIPGFVIQGGDPNSKNGSLYDSNGNWLGTDFGAIRRLGTGGPGYNVNAEFNERKHTFGVLSMARAADPNSAGSQFFVCLGDLPSLDGKYTTFGKMIEGDSVLRTIGTTPTVRPGDYPKVRQGMDKVRVL